jgi:hypothetical protein
LTCSPSADCSAGLVASSLALSALECVFCGIAKPMSSASTSSGSGGLVSRAFPTCAISWRTPEATDADRGPSAEMGGLRPSGAVRALNLVTQVHHMHRLGKCLCRCHTSMSSAAASPAKTSVLPVPGQASPRGPARVFGTSSPDSFATFDPATSSWRTSQLSLLEDSTSFSGTWPRAGMTRSGIASRLVPLAPLTGGTASGSLPTPDASVANLGEGPETWYARREKLKDKGYNGNGAGVPLSIAAQVGPRYRTWPTPTARDHKDTGENTNYAHLEKKSRLAGVVVMEGRRQSDAVAVPRVLGQLNPTWVEWLMGYPLGWTVSAAWETRSSRRSRNGSAAGSSRTKRK